MKVKPWQFLLVSTLILAGIEESGSGGDAVLSCDVSGGGR